MYVIGIEMGENDLEEEDKMREEKIFHKKNIIIFVEWLLLVSIILTAFLSIYYYDISCTVDNSILLLKSIWHGEFFEFYDFAIGKTQTVWAPNYEILMYIIFAIWNIPLALLYKLFGVDYLYSMGAILWTKLFLMLCLLLITFILYKICIFLEINKERIWLVVFLFLSSINVLVPTVMTAQCDIVNLVFIMLGIYMYLQGKTKKFIACFAIAIPLKMFAIFILVPLILLDEKKIIRALLKILASLSGLLVCKAISWKSVSYHYLVKSFSDVMTEQLQFSDLELGIGKFSVFIGCVVAICIWAYTKKVEDKERKQFVIYIPFFVFSLMFAFFAFYPYWIVLLAPFTVLCIVTSPKYLKLNILLESLSGITGFLCCAMRYWWIYSQDTLRTLMISKIIDFENCNRKYTSINQILQEYGIDKYQNAIYTVFVISLLALVILNFPRKKENDTVLEYEIVEHSVLFVRLVLLTVILGLWIGVGVVQEAESVFDTMENSTAVKSYESILPEANQIIQKFSIEEDSDIDEIELQFYNEATSHINVSEVVVSIKEEATGKEIFLQRIGTSVIGDQNIKVKVNKTLKKGTYMLCLSGRNDNGEMVSPMLTDTLVYRDYPILINGKEYNQNLYCKIYKNDK